MSKVIKKNLEYHVSIKIILKNKKGEILILKMPDKSSMGGYYDFPGGRIGEKEANISLKKIIKREIYEEVGKKVKFSLKETPVAIGRHWYYSKKYKKIQHLFWVFFEAVYMNGKIRISSEHKGYSWVKLTKNNYKKYFVRGPLEGAYNYLLKK